MENGRPILWRPYYPAPIADCQITRWVIPTAIWLCMPADRIEAARSRPTVRKKTLQENARMSKLTLGIVCGVVYGLFSVATMIPLEFADKKAAMLGAFINRFSIGFVIGIATLPLPGWARGLLIGLLLSLADAIITKAYAPILGLGAIGGLIIGLIVQKWGH
jgi:hypothetical protein